MTPLHEPLSERRFADERASLVVPNRSGNDFSGAGGPAVDEHDKRNIEGRLTTVDNRLGDEIIVVLEIEILVKSGPGVCGDEAAYHLLSAAHPPAPIATEIQHD